MAKNNNAIFLIIGILLVVTIFLVGPKLGLFQIAGNTMTRNVPSAVNIGEKFLVVYTASATGQWGASIEDSISGGCKFPDGSNQLKTVMLSSDGDSKAIEITAPSSSGSCTFSGDYKFGTEAITNFPDKTITVSTSVIDKCYAYIDGACQEVSCDLTQYDLYDTLKECQDEYKNKYVIFRTRIKDFYASSWIMFRGKGYGRTSSSFSVGCPYEGADFESQKLLDLSEIGGGCALYTYELEAGVYDKYSTNHLIVCCNSQWAKFYTGQTNSAILSSTPTEPYASEGREKYYFNCIPSYTDKECGDDGCGGKYGICQPSYNCVSGQCITTNGNGDDCTSHDDYSCYGNDVYWYDSCGVKEDKKEECGYGCTGSGQCRTSANGNGDGNGDGNGINGNGNGIPTFSLNQVLFKIGDFEVTILILLIGIGAIFVIKTMFLKGGKK